MATFSHFIQCERCGAKAVGTLTGARTRDGNYCAACGRRHLEEWLAAQPNQPKSDT